MDNDLLTIADRTFRSRLIVGTGKYASHDAMRRAHDASGAEMVTVAVRRVDLHARDGSSLLDHIDTDRYALLPNTPAATPPTRRSAPPGWGVPPG